MQVIAEPTPTLTGNNLQTVLQSLFCTGPPDDNARYQDKDKHQRGSAHNHFPPEDASIGLHAVQQPAMQAEHGREKRRTLILALYLTRILVYIDGSTTRFGKVHLPGTLRSRRGCDTRHRNTIRQSSGHFFGHLAHGKRCRPDFLHIVEVAVAELHHLRLEYQHGSGKTDKGNQ